MRNLDQPFRTAVRDSVKAHGMNEMAIQATAADEVDRVVTEHLLTIMKETGVPVKILDVSLGRANPPDAILHQRVETAAQEQRINTEKQKKLAETSARSPKRAARPPTRRTTRRWGSTPSSTSRCRRFKCSATCVQGQLHLHLRRQRDAPAEYQMRCGRRTGPTWRGSSQLWVATWWGVC